MVIAATMGVGIFALPYVVAEAGWLTSFCYLVFVIAITVQTHNWYWRVLQKAEGQRLLGLIGRHGGRVLFFIAFLSIVVGLLLVLATYLVLAGSFFNLLFPGQEKIIGVMIIWLLGSLPLLAGVRRLTILESLGALATFFILLGLFSHALWQGGQFPAVPAATANFFLPFGPLLFALAGWTALEPIYDTEERKKAGDGFRGVAWGTVLAGFFYVVFVTSIFLLTSEISSDTISSLSLWPGWERILLSFFGLLLITNAYIPIAWEVHTALEKDLYLGRWAFVVPMVVPLGLFLMGLNSFFLLVSLVGGLFLSLQYLGIVFVSSRVLVFSKKEKILATIIAFVFALAAFYEALSFLLR